MDAVVEMPITTSSMSAKQFAVKIAKALEGKSVHDEELMDFSLMQERRWTWQELIDTPLWVILSISFINGRMAVFDKLRTLKEENK